MHGARTVNGDFTIRNMLLITRANRWREIDMDEVREDAMSQRDRQLQSRPEREKELITFLKQLNKEKRG